MGGKGSGAPKGNRNNPNLGRHMQADSLNPSVSSAIMRYDRELFALACEPFDIADPEQLQKRIDDFFEITERHGMKPLITGLAICLGIERKTFSEVAKTNNTAHNGRGRVLAVPDACTEILKKTHRFMEEFHMQAGLDSKSGMPTVMGIFAAKNWYGYRNPQDVQISAAPADPLLTDGKDAEAIAAKYADALPKASDSHSLPEATITVDPATI